MRYFFLLMLSLLFAACKTQKAAIERVKTDELQLVPLAFDYLSAKGKMEYRADGEDTNANLDLRIAADSIIWLSIRSGAGLEGVRALLTTDSAFVVNRLNKEYYRLSYRELSDFYDFPLTFDLVQSILLGELPKLLNMKNRMQKTEDKFITQSNAKGIRADLEFSRLYNKLIKMQVEEKRTDALLDLNYGAFEDVDTDAFPMDIRAILDFKRNGIARNIELDIDYSRVRRDDELKFPFSVSDSYKEISGPSRK